MNEVTDKNMLPDFLIIGVQKSGTSWLHRELSKHPELFLPKKKELRFYIDSKNFTGNVVNESSLQAYINFFKSVPVGTLKGEATPEYIFQTQCAERIHKLKPDTKLIVLLRQPAERAFSQWRMISTHKKIDTTLSFLEAFDRNLPENASMKERGLYEKQLKRIFSIFPHKNIQILFYDDLVADPKAFLHETYKFLNVKNYYSEDYTNRLIARYEEKCDIRKKMTVEEKVQLTNYYRDSILNLEELLSVNLSHWL